MALQYAVRWRPVPFRSTIETISTPDQTDENGAVIPGQRIQTLQAIAFDDTKVGTAGNPYRPGDPATEQHLAIIEEVPIQLDIAAFAGKTVAQATALWNGARDAQKAAWLADPHIQAKIMAAVGGALSPFVVLD
jgi:hypothetical protein